MKSGLCLKVINGGKKKMYEYMLKNMLRFFDELHSRVEDMYEAEKAEEAASQEWKRREEETFGLDVVN